MKILKRKIKFPTSAEKKSTTEKAILPKKNSQAVLCFCLISLYIWNMKYDINLRWLSIKPTIFYAEERLEDSTNFLESTNFC